jgi:CRISPR-associated protein Csm3
MERVPADVAFTNAELVYSIYEGDRCDSAKDVERLGTILQGLQLLEDDYLGGQGSRGSGKVRLENIRVEMRGKDYASQRATLGNYPTLGDFASGLDSLRSMVSQGLA